MTWKEFKELVEKQLQEKGLTEDVVLEYIDWSGEDAPEVVGDDAKGYAVV